MVKIRGIGSLSRRTFAKGLGALALAPSLTSCSSRPTRFKGQIVGAPATHAHRLRTGGFGPPISKSKAGVTIVGGGMSALCAAWWLQRNGFEDFKILELDSAMGGSSRSGSNQVSAFPWGAHYVPVPNRESLYVKLLFEELGIITGYDASGKPQFNDYFLCHAPEERLYIYGRWQQGLLPEVGANAEDHRQYKKFHSLMEEYRNAKGSDDKFAFAIPIAESSQDKKFTDLDLISFEQFLNNHSLHSAPLRWYLDYCCRDDYGGKPADISAWAGIHYFAGRRSEGADLGESDLLTWPAGNGWLVNKLAAKFPAQITCNALAFKIETSGNKVATTYLDTAKDEIHSIISDYVIYCAPRFTAPFVIGEMRNQTELIRSLCQYSPWMVANITVGKLPERRDELPAWDNVIYQSPSLGYVLATHQSLRSREGATVMTYYKPLCAQAPPLERKAAEGKTHDDWCSEIIAELRGPHPELSRHVKNLDVWLWGHGMIRPTVGYTHSTTRQTLGSQQGRIFFAHSDMSGISIFEEAQYHGVLQAQRVLKSLKS